MLLMLMSAFNIYEPDVHIRTEINHGAHNQRKCMQLLLSSSNQISYGPQGPMTNDLCSFEISKITFYS